MNVRSPVGCIVRTGPARMAMISHIPPWRIDLIRIKGAAMTVPYPSTSDAAAGGREAESSA